MNKDLLDNITKTTRAIWLESSAKIGIKNGRYRYSLGVNGLGEVVLTDFSTNKTVAKGNREVQKMLRELAK